MKKSTPPYDLPTCEPVFAARSNKARPVALVRRDAAPGLKLTAAQSRWVEQAGFKGAARKQVVVPDADGSIGAVLLGIGNGAEGDPSGSSDLLAGLLAAGLPGGDYGLEGEISDPTLAAIAWGLGGYRFERYKSRRANGPDDGSKAPARLVMPAGAEEARVRSTVEAVWLARDLINTPASDLGPEEIEAAVRAVGAKHGAKVSAVVGEELLDENFPLIHAVGRASPRAPRLISLEWKKKGSKASAPLVTLVGKGITFDTGGLDLKPASAMLLMKKDMGGAATALAAADMIMSQGLDVRLRLLIASAENSVSGDAFRPGDVIKSRAGTTVEIGNTDAEGRLVLADALSLADEAEPDTMIIFATLTGAARTALGPDLPALFSNDDQLAASLIEAGREIGDPVWRMPLWPGYDRHLDSDVADINNVWESPFAGAITAALFLKRFVKRARRFAHIDLYGWRTTARPLGPKGGEPQSARAVVETLRKEVMR